MGAPATLPTAGPASALLSPGRHGVVATFDALRLALFGTVLLAIGRIHQHYAFLMPLRPALLLLLFAFGFAFLNPRLLNTGKLLSTWPARTVAGIAVMACASALLGISMGASASIIIADYWKVLLVAFLLIAATRQTGDVVTFMWAFVLGCAFQVYLALFFFQLSKGNSLAMRLDDLYMFDANDISCVLLSGLGVAALLAQTTKGYRRVAAIMIVFGIGAAVARSGSRGGLIGLVAVTVGLLIALKGVSLVKRAGFVVAMAVGLTLFTPPGYWEQMATILEPKKDYNWTDENGRRQIWKRGIGYMMDYPIAGVGVGNFSRAECMIGPKAKNTPAGKGVWCAAPHNTFVEVGAEMGVPGLALWLTLIFGGIFGLRRFQRQLPRQWERGDPEARFLFLAPTYLSICWIGFAATSFFVTFGLLDLPYLLAALTAGILIAAQARLNRDRAVPPLSPASPAPPAASLVSRGQPEWRSRRAL